jgi:hypothetical protein
VLSTRYLWFAETESGNLAEAGATYVKQPTHDPD